MDKSKYVQVLRGQKKVSDSLELECQGVVGAEN